MSKPVPKDARDRVISVGDFVCYTTNSRGGGLGFGTVSKINERSGYQHRWDDTAQQWVRQPTLLFKIRVDITDAFGNPKFETEWDAVSRTRVDTDRRSKSGLIDHSSHKFLRL